MISNHNDHDVSIKLSKHIIMLQGVYKYPNICKTSQHMRNHSLLNYFIFYLNSDRCNLKKIVTKDAFFNLKPSFFGSVICLVF